MLVLGVGIGLSMQVLTIIVQNTVDYRDLGVATSGVTFFRTMGSSFGAAVVRHALRQPAGAQPGHGRRRHRRRPDAGHIARGGAGAAAGRSRPRSSAAYADTLQYVFASAIPVAVVAFVVALFLKQVPMRGLTQPGASEIGPAFAIPDQRTAQEQLEGQVVRILRTRLPEAAERLLLSSQSGLDGVQVWTLRQVAIQQIHVHGPADPYDIAASHRVPMALIRPAIDDCVARGLLQDAGRSGGADASRAASSSVRSCASCGSGWSPRWSRPTASRSTSRAARTCAPSPAARCSPTTPSPSRRSSPRPAPDPGRPRLGRT